MATSVTAPLNAGVNFQGTWDEWNTGGYGQGTAPPAPTPEMGFTPGGQWQWTGNAWNWARPEQTNIVATSPQNAGQYAPLANTQPIVPTQPIAPTQTKVPVGNASATGAITNTGGTNAGAGLGQSANGVQYVGSFTSANGTPTYMDANGNFYGADGIAFAKIDPNTGIVEDIRPGKEGQYLGRVKNGILYDSKGNAMNFNQGGTFNYNTLLNQQTSGAPAGTSATLPEGNWTGSFSNVREDGSLGPAIMINDKNELWQKTANGWMQVGIKQGNAFYDKNGNMLGFMTADGKVMAINPNTGMPNEAQYTALAGNEAAATETGETVGTTTGTTTGGIEEGQQFNYPGYWEALANALANPQTLKMNTLADLMASPEYFQALSKPFTEALARDIGGRNLLGGSSYGARATAEVLGNLWTSNLNNVFNQYSTINQQLLPYMEAYWKEPDQALAYLLSF